MIKVIKKILNKNKPSERLEKFFTIYDSECSIAFFNFMDEFYFIYSDKNTGEVFILSKGEKIKLSYSDLFFNKDLNFKKYLRNKEEIDEMLTDEVMEKMKRKIIDISKERLD